MNKLVSLQLEKLKLTLQAQMGLSHPAQPSMQLEWHGQAKKIVQKEYYLKIDLQSVQVAIALLHSNKHSDELHVATHWRYSSLHLSEQTRLKS